MKKSIIFGLMGALILVASCLRDPEDLRLYQGEMTLTAYTELPAASRTVVESGTQVFWEPGDELAVFWGSRGGKFSSELSEPAATATFKGRLSDWTSGTEIWALYPYNESAVFDGNTITTVIPSNQTARAGSFFQGQNISVARSTSSTLYFRNVLGGVRFTVRETNVKQITLKGNSGEILAGRIAIGLDSEGIPFIDNISDPATEITLTAPNGGTFSPDTWYFISAIPGSFDAGVTVTSDLSDGTIIEKNINSQIQVKRGIFGTVRGLGKPMTQEEAEIVLHEGEDLLDSDNEEDLDKAFERFFEATEAGLDSAKLYLAYCYEYGLGTEQDLDKAKELYAEVAAGGNQEAQMKVDQLVEGNTNAEIVIPGATPRDLEQVVLLCDGTLKTPNGDGTFQADENHIIASTADEELIYISFRNPGRDKANDDLVLNATETALSMLMWSIPFGFEEMTDEAFAGMRAVLGSFQETEALISAISNSISEFGYMDLDRISPELEAATAKVNEMYDISDLGPIEKPTIPFTIGANTPMAPSFKKGLWSPAESPRSISVKVSAEDESSSGKPTMKYGPVYYSDWLYGTKVILKSVDKIPGIDKWKCSFLFYNYEPIYLALMHGINDRGSILPDGHSYLDHIVKPQNATYIFQMGGAEGVTKTIKAQYAFWRDTFLWAKGEKDFEDGSWNATETKFEMEIDSERDLLLVYSTSNCPQLFAYATFQLAVLPFLKMVLKVEDDSVEDMVFNAFYKYGTDAKFILKAEKVLEEQDFEGFLDLIIDTAWDTFLDAVDVMSKNLFEKAVQPRYKKIVKKWEDYDLADRDRVLAERAKVKQDLADLKTLKQALKAEKIVINLIAWWVRQSMFRPYYVEFDFSEVNMGVQTGDPYEDPYNVSVHIPITITGGSPVVKRGVVWSTSDKFPTMDEEGCTTQYSNAQEKEFEVWISGVPGGRRSYFRSFIIYNKGTGEDVEERLLYGNVVDYIPSWSLRQLDDEIWYTSTDGEIVLPSNPNAFGDNEILANFFHDGQGIIKFKNPVTEVGEKAFEDCATLQSIQLPKTVTDIGKYAFRFCSSLQRADIPGNLTSCGELAFACQNLKAFTGPNAAGNGRFLIIDERLVAFAPKDMNEVEIPSGVSFVGPLAFGGCTEVTSITVPEGVTHLETGAFLNTIRLASVSLPQSLTNVGDEIFSGCFELDEITFPSNVTSVGTDIFDRCYALKEAHFRSVTPPIRSGILASGFSPDLRIYVPNSSLEVYKTSDKWSDDADIILPESAQPDNPSNSDLPTPKGNELYYSSTDGNIIVPNTEYDSFGANIVSNTYENGVGCIVFDKDINVIPPHAYDQRVSLASIRIPEGVQIIERDAFYGCSSLTGIETPNSLTTIRSAAFEYCTSLSFFISNSTLTIDNWVFDGCTSLKTLEFRRRMESIRGFRDHPYLTSVSFTEGVSSIDEFTFFNCPSLTYVNIGSGVNSIGGYAFKDCSSLKSIIIDGETEIGGSAFNNCTDLSTVILKGGVKTIGASAFFNCSSLLSIEVPSTVLSIGESAFCGCSSLISARIRARITSIENSLFKDCSSLESISFSNDFKTIGSSAFYGCSKLKSIILPSTLTSIGDLTFYECTSLKNVIIPPNVTSIEDNLFHGCTSLESVSLPVGLKSIGWCAFSDCAALYDVTIPSSVSSIGGSAFSSCSSLTSITIPSGITIIPWDLFYNCSSLVSVSIPSSVIEIKGEAFMGCSSLRDITIPNSVKAIGSKVFQNCSSVKYLTLSEGITTIPEYSFDNCSSLESFIIPESVSSIGERAFRGCSSMRSINLPYALSSLPKYAFQGCSSLESISIPSSITFIDQFCFYNCSSISSVIIPEGITSLEREVFRGCTSLAHVELPSSLTGILVNAFQTCPSLSKVILKATTPPSLPQSPYTAFWVNDIKNCTFYVPAESVNTYKTADRWSQYADKIQPIENLSSSTP